MPRFLKYLLLNAAIISSGFLLINWNFIAHADLFAPRDNIVFHLYNFLYHANSLALYHVWPSWYPIAGGTPTGVASMAWVSHSVSILPDWQIHPRGFTLTKIPSLPGLILLPYSWAMHPKITTELGNTPSSISLLDGAVTGILSDGSFQTLHLTMPYTSYEWSLLIQLVAFLGVLFFTCKFLRLPQR